MCLACKFDLQNWNLTKNVLTMYFGKKSTGHTLETCDQRYGAVNRIKSWIGFMHLFVIQRVYCMMLLDSPTLLVYNIRFQISCFLFKWLIWTPSIWPPSAVLLSCRNFYFQIIDVLFVTSTGGFVNAATESDNEKAALAALYLAGWPLLLVVVGHLIALLICFAGFLVMWASLPVINTFLNW